MCELLIIGMVCDVFFIHQLLFFELGKIDMINRSFSQEVKEG
jgi:hypothetical protein